MEKHDARRRVRISLLSDGRLLAAGYTSCLYTPDEFESERRRSNPIVLEAVEIGVNLLQAGQQY